MATEGQQFTADLAAWVRDVFGEEILADRKERVARLLEEVLELAQAEGLDEVFAARMARRVFSRERGDPTQEAAQVAVTLFSYGASVGLDVLDAGRTELARISTPEFRQRVRERHAAKVAQGLGTAGKPSGG